MPEVVFGVRTYNVCGELKLKIIQYGLGYFQYFSD